MDDDRLRDGVQTALAQGWSEQAVIDRMIDHGYAPDRAMRVVHGAVEQHRRQHSSWSRFGRVLGPVLDEGFWEASGRPVVVGGAILVVLLSLFPLLTGSTVFAAVSFLHMVIAIGVLGIALSRDHSFIVHVSMAFLLAAQLVMIALTALIGLL